MKGFSKIKWFLREDVFNELALNFASLPDFVGSLLEDEIADASTQKMYDILSTKAVDLQIELALKLDLQSIITTCYALCTGG